MKKLVILLSSLIVAPLAAQVMVENKLSLLELDAQRVMNMFRDLSQNMSIASISESIVSHDAQMLKNALQDVISLNKVVNSQINVAIQFWNAYLDGIPTPTDDQIRLGHVVNSLIETIRSLSLRSSLDQAMILSFIKKHFGENQNTRTAPKTDLATAVEAKSVTVEDRWKMMRIQ